MDSEYMKSLEDKLKAVKDQKWLINNIERDISDMVNKKDSPVSFGGTSMPTVCKKISAIVWNMVYVDLQKRLKEEKYKLSQMMKP